ncbi:hypothetical protein NEUTE1DRAFT_39637 [Neurospora tetrasperma FGSC 2508]|uniref:Uncharacterized protein n=1 Tax=Neurospora tetrasperma (strain FGSC 2508 / ATCC MYA-4615 / P0657) TaxID=510951 RepID=F8MGA1_NEUT8|nr:uncharacterized protein NEUTE1DRAFT_39637 [Neurospora tetrasperma FGSC 2508]EGO58576.1 hypothetical protein NEUTE1DRAFT_39637 [Neurospora tetrasperma FGSC 2508]EGZ72644.1 hypothetical protein NEUTE2DRAFT_127025 [Neurospora tetrasperma FGSC 2509]
MRMQAILAALSKNKSVAHAYLQVSAPNRFVAAPKAEIKAPLSGNQTSNDNKVELVREGLKAKKAEGKIGSRG